MPLPAHPRVSVLGGHSWGCTEHPGASLCFSDLLSVNSSSRDFTDRTPSPFNSVGFLINEKGCRELMLPTGSASDGQRGQDRARQALS